MANRERGELRLELRRAEPPRVYTLRLTVEACCELEDRSGRNLDAIVMGVNAHSIRDVRWLLWASLQAYHGAEFPSVDRAGPVIDGVGTVDACVNTLAAFMALNADPDPQTVQSSKSVKAPSDAWRRLYIDARSVGVDGDRFWTLSLRELFLELAVGRKQGQRDRALAWFIAGLTKSKKLPDFAQWIGIQRKQTPQELAANVAILKEMYPNSKPKHGTEPVERPKKPRTTGHGQNVRPRRR